VFFLIPDVSPEDDIIDLEDVETDENGLVAGHKPHENVFEVIEDDGRLEVH